MSKAHAERNQQVCDFLSENSKYHDWVVTTAFYSALHFVQHQIFPLLRDGITYKSFDDYYTRALKGKKPSKHKATITLVSQELPEIGSHYQFLYDNSWTARYRSYNIAEAIANLCRKKLEVIKEHCK